jgi:threonine dehydrogenase-like Zn-dependent dehydrogenase
VRAVVLDEAGRPELAEVPKPEAAAGEDLVQVEAALTDGTPLLGAFCGIEVAKGRRVVAPSQTWPYAEYVVAKDLLPVPPSLGPDVAALAAPLGGCLHAVELADLQAGQTVALRGAGPFVLMLSAAARDTGATVMATEPNELTHEFGALPEGAARADVAIEVTSVPEVGKRDLRAALAFLASGAYPWERLVTERVWLDELPDVFADPSSDLLLAAVYP